MSHQYYPTGAHTAARMWGKFKKPVRHICDPSAGKGHLLRHAQEGFPSLSEEQIPWLERRPGGEQSGESLHSRFREYARRKFEGLPEVSVVEIDLQHHASLKELGAKIIGYDFLDVCSLATVSHIIMNPPFAAGAKHLLHAWDVAYDAEIVAIINAETLHNPFSEDRKRLARLIADHGSVEFLKDQFIDDVDRTTEVEIALIHLEKVPGKYLNMDSLLGGLTRGDRHAGKEIDPQMSSALALPSNFIQDTCFRFEQAVQAAREASEAMAVANHLAHAVGVTLEEMQAKGVGNSFRETADPVREAANDQFRKSYDDLKKRAWAQILRSSVLTDKLSNQARKKVEASASDIYHLEFNAANIHGFLLGVIESMGDIYQTMVVDLFDTIIGRTTDNVVFYKAWKSNEKHRTGVRIRKSRFIIPHFRVYHSGSLEYESAQFLADIDKVFGYLHGDTRPYDGLVQGFKQKGAESGARIKTKFFDFRFYKGSGTIHFYPAEGVVEKINKFVGQLRNWIPGDMSEANEDFCTQYENGEALTKEYLAQYKGSARGGGSYGRDCPAYQVLRAAQGGEGDVGSLERLGQAIAKVHADKGLECRSALADPTSRPLLLAA